MPTATDPTTVSTGCRPRRAWLYRQRTLPPHHRHVSQRAALRYPPLQKHRFCTGLLALSSHPNRDLHPYNWMAREREYPCAGRRHPVVVIDIGETPQQTPDAALARQSSPLRIRWSTGYQGSPARTYSGQHAPGIHLAQHNCSRRDCFGTIAMHFLKGICCAIHRDFELLRHSKQGCRDVSVSGNHNHIAQLRSTYGVPGNIVQILKQQVQQT